MIREPKENPDYQDVIDDPTLIAEWDNVTLLGRFLDIRFLIMTETRLTSNADRIGRAIQVGRMEHEEILRRMEQGHREDSLDNPDRGC